MLSYDDKPEIRELYQEGFYIFEERWIYSINSRANDPSRVRPTGNELIITNYNPEEMAGIEDVSPGDIAAGEEVA